MTRKLALGALCVAVSLTLMATPASAQIITGMIAPEVTKVYSLTTDTSTIIQIQAVAFHERTDLDILVTTGEGIDEEVVLDSRSGVLQLELGAVGVEGATDVTISITNADGPKSRFAVTVTEPAKLDTVRGRNRLPLQKVGEFGLHEQLDDPRLAWLQELVRKRPSR